jgi:hypothetical protein
VAFAPKYKNAAAHPFQGDAAAESDPRIEGCDGVGVIAAPPLLVSDVTPEAMSIVSPYLSAVFRFICEPMTYVRSNRRVALHSGDSLDVESQ